MMWPFRKRRFPFRDAPETAVITCCHVLNGAAILRVTHDAEDGMWQFLCGADHAPDEARVISLQEAYVLDTTITQVASMPCGCVAVRKPASAAWQISNIE